MSQSSPITFTLPVHPDPAQARTLDAMARIQDFTRDHVWELIRLRLPRKAVNLTWPRPHHTHADIGVPTGGPELPGPGYVRRDVIKQAIRGELQRLRQHPDRVSWDHLWPDLQHSGLLTLPGRPVLIGDDTLLLFGDLALTIDAFTLPAPFLAAALRPGAERSARWRARLVTDLAACRPGTVPDETILPKLRSHLTTYGPAVTGHQPCLLETPGIELTHASLACRTGPDGERRWVCDLMFTVAPGAAARWFPAADDDEPVGIDPGQRRALTWATATRSGSTGPLLDLERIDVDPLAPLGQVAAAALRRSVWQYHHVEFGDVLVEVLRHRVVGVERTCWSTMARLNAGFVVQARDNCLWTWLGHLEALAGLTGSQVRWVAPEGTSTTCSECGVVAPDRQRERFVCRGCGSNLPIDVNAARIIAQRAAVH